MPDVDVCHLNLAKNYRGGERQTEILIRALAEHNLEQRLVVKRNSSLKARCADVSGLEIREVASNPLAAGLAVRGAALAHAHEGRSVYAGWIANRLFGTPYLITRRVVSTQKNRVMRGVAYRRAACVVGVSRAAVQSLNQSLDAEKVAVIPDAHAAFDSDPDVVATIRSRYPGKVLIGNIAAMVHAHKGQSTIIDVARRVSVTYPDWHFLLCGDGADMERYRDEIGDLQNIELVGWVENVGDYLASFDLFLYPSLHEALGSTLLDAMHFGLPIVASQVDGIPDVVKDGVNGKLVPPENPDAIVAAIAGLLADRPILQAMRDGNREKANLFDAEHMTNAYLEAYAGV